MKHPNFVRFKKMTGIVAASTLAVALTFSGSVDAFAKTTPTTTFATVETTGRKQTRISSCSLNPEHQVYLFGNVIADSEPLNLLVPNVMVTFNAKQYGDCSKAYSKGYYSFGKNGSDCDIIPKTCFNPNCTLASANVTVRKSYNFTSKKKATVKLYAE